MPTYTFLNKTTNEVEEHTFRMAQYDEFVAQNPNLERYHAPGESASIGDSVRLGITKPPSDFQKYVVDRIKHTVPGNNIKSKFGIPREN